MGSWHQPGTPFDASKVHEDIKYTEEDDKAIDDFLKANGEFVYSSLTRLGCYLTSYR